MTYDQRMTPTRRKIEYLLLSEVQSAERNPKLHDDDSLDASIARFGFTEPVLMDERTGRLVAGHGRLARLRAAEAEGGPPPDGVIAGRDGWKIPVVRGWASTDDREAEAYLIASNRIVETGGWDAEGLAEMLTDVVSGARGVLEGTGFSLGEMSDLLDAVRVTDDEVEPDLDVVPESPVDPVSSVGSVWTLGNSRLVCGDATSADVIDLALDGSRADMVWTDPPYGVSYVGGTADALTIENDDLSIDDLTDLLRRSLGIALARSQPGACWFVAAPSGPSFLAFAMVLSELRVWRQTLVWVKDQFVLGHADYHGRHENLVFGSAPGRSPRRYTQAHTEVMYGWTPGGPHKAPPDRTHDSVWEFAKPRASLDHPTMKPVGLIERAIRTHTVLGDLVLDPFGGSGSTLIAAFGAGRRAAVVEKDPRYADVICARFQRHTGILPRREDGTEVDFLSG